jgi:hypothetical protein
MPEVTFTVVPSNINDPRFCGLVVFGVMATSTQYVPDAAGALFSSAHKSITSLLMLVDDTLLL